MWKRERIWQYSNNIRNKIEDFDDSENENYHNSERKRIRIISDIERESETKDADENEENIVKAGSRR